MTTRRQRPSSWFGQAGLAQLLNNRGEELGRRRQIEQVIRLRAVFLVHIGELRGQGRIRGRIGEFAALIEEPLGEPLPGFRAAVFGWQKSGDLVAKLVAAQVVEGDAHHRKIPGKQFGFHQVEKRGNQLALGQVAGGAEQHHHAWTGGLANLFVFLLPDLLGLRWPYDLRLPDLSG